MRQEHLNPVLEVDGNYWAAEYRLGDNEWTQVADRQTTYSGAFNVLVAFWKTLKAMGGKPVMRIVRVARVFQEQEELASHAVEILEARR